MYKKDVAFVGLRFIFVFKLGTGTPRTDGRTDGRRGRTCMRPIWRPHNRSYAVYGFPSFI